MAGTFNSVDKQVREMFDLTDISLKFDYIFTVLNPDLAVKTRARPYSESFVDCLRRSPYTRRHVIEIWMLFPEIAPDWGTLDTTSLYRDLWREAQCDAYHRRETEAMFFPGQTGVEANYASQIPNIRKVFFPPPDPNIQRLKDIIELREQMSAHLIKELKESQKLHLTRPNSIRANGIEPTPA